MTASPQSHSCAICGKTFARADLTSGELIRDSLAAEIKRGHPKWTRKSFICRDDLNRVRDAYVHSLIATDKRELSSLERDVITSLTRHETLSIDPEKEWEVQATLGERLSDRVASFGGSWRFIIFFFGFILFWMAVNLGFVFSQPLDPYPFIFLNLMLSCLAAIQAPIIMMSQNRQESRDRVRSKNDYKINLKAELEIRQLHEKVDHLLQRQWERLIEIQEIQIELMNEMTQRMPRRV